MGQKSFKVLIISKNIKPELNKINEKQSLRLIQAFYQDKGVGKKHMVLGKKINN